MNQKSPIEIKIIDIAYLTELKGGAKLSYTRWRKRKEYNGNEKYNYILVNFKLVTSISILKSVTFKSFVKELCHIV